MRCHLVFCPYCGSPMNEDHLYCMSCGKRVERITSPSNKTTPPTIKTTSPKSKTKPVQNEAASQAPVQAKAINEYVVGGFSSADMARPGSLGYGIYITNKRVIGIKQPGQFAKAVGGAIAGAVMGAVLGFEAPWAVSSALGRSLSNDENLHLLEELEKNKDFEIYNEDITLVQLKETFLINPGQLAFFLKGAKTTDIAISLRTDKVVESLKELLTEHFPKVLKVVI
jgi:hypothetical protein